MISIAFTNRKGGVGKTAISTHVAAQWATMGNRVLLIDTDPQGDACRMMGMKPTNGLYNLLVPDPETGETAPLENVLKPVPASAYSVPDSPATGALFILPSASNTSTIAALTDNPFILAEKVNELKALFDVIVIDTSPTVTAFDAYVYLASDYYVFVTQCETLSTKGLREGIKQVERFSPMRERHMGAKSQVLKIVPNMMDSRLTIHRELMKDMVEDYGAEMLCNPIMYRKQYKEATEMGQLIYAYAPSSGEANDMRRMSAQVQEAVENVLP